MGVSRRVTAVFTVGLVAVVACRVALETSATQQPAISFPSNTIFTAPVNGSATIPITIAPADDKVSSSDTIMNITPIGACSEWVLNLPPLPANVTNNCGSGTGTGTGSTQTQTAVGCIGNIVRFSPVFAPKDPGSSSCTLKLDTNTGAKNLILTGDATPLTVDLRLAEGFSNPVSCNPCSTNFGDVDVTSTSVTNLEILNVGSQSDTISNIATSNPIFEIVGGDPGNVTIPPGEKVAFQVQCRPTGPTNVIPGTLTFDSANVNTLVSQTLAMTCRGIQSDLQFLDSGSAISQIDLTTRIHEPKTIPITLKNKGNLPMTIDEFVVSAPNTVLSLAPPIRIEAGAQTDMTITFLPTQEVSDLGTLVAKFAPGGDGNQRELALNGGALATQFEIVLDPPSLGKLCIGDQRRVNFTARAVLEGSIQLKSISVDDADHDPFTLANNPAPFTLMGGRRNEATFDVDVAPTSVQPMSIVLITDIPEATSTFPASTPVVIDIPAEILAAGVAGPESTAFQEVELGSEAFTRAIEISNCSDQAVEIAGATISNGDFEIVAGDFTQIGPRATVTYQVAMKTSVPGAKVAKLTVRTADADIEVSLSGEVLGDEARDSYYACSSNSPSGWLLVFGIVSLVLGRRRNQQRVARR